VYQVGKEAKYMINIRITLNVCVKTPF